PTATDSAVTFEYLPRDMFTEQMKNDVRRSVSAVFFGNSQRSLAKYISDILNDEPLPLERVEVYFADFISGAQLEPSYLQHVMGSMLSVGEVFATEAVNHDRSKRRLQAVEFRVRDREWVPFGGSMFTYSGSSALGPNVIYSVNHMLRARNTKAYTIALRRP